MGQRERLQDIFKCKCEGLGWYYKDRISDVLAKITGINCQFMASKIVRYIVSVVDIGPLSSDAGPLSPENFPNCTVLRCS